MSALADRLRARSGLVATEILAAWQRESPRAAAFTDEQREQAVFACQAVLDLTLTGWSTGTAMDAGVVEALRMVAVDRARSRFPLRDLRANWRLSFVVATRIGLDGATESELQELTTLLDWMGEHLPPLGVHTTTAYLAETAAVHGRHEVYRHVAEALIDNDHAEVLAAAAGLTLPAYLVPLAVTDTPAVRDWLVDRDVLWSVHEGLLIVLAGTASAAPDRVAPVTGPVATLVDEVTATVGGQSTDRWVAVGEPLAAAGLADGLTRLTEVARMAAGQGRHGMVRGVDLAMDTAVRDDPLVRGVLSPLHRALAGREHLVATLRALLRNEFNHTATARELGVHRNTVDRRVQAVADLIGHPPASTTGVQVVSALLALLAET